MIAGPTRLQNCSHFHQGLLAVSKPNLSRLVFETRFLLSESLVWRMLRISSVLEGVSGSAGFCLEEVAFS